MSPVLDGRQVESVPPRRDRFCNRDNNGPGTAIEYKLIKREWLVLGHGTWIVDTLKHHQRAMFDLPCSPRGANMALNDTQTLIQSRLEETDGYEHPEIVVPGA